MKKSITAILAAIALITAPACALAEASALIPPFHWTYHSLSDLSSKGLIDEEVIPGKSAYTPEQVVAMLVMALKHTEQDISKLGALELTSMRQLANAYRPYFKEAGYDYDAVRNDIEICAMRAGLTISREAGEYKPNEKIRTAQAAVSVNEFTFDIYKKASEKLQGENLFISPYSVSSALAMVYSGARGITEKQMDQVLRFDPDIHKRMGALTKAINSVPEDIAQINVANAIWPSKDEKILPEFAQTVQSYYGADLKALNYKANPEAARRTINKWVEKQTKEKIKDILPGGVLTKETKMVLTNAVYFKSEWQEQFQAVNTVPRPFWKDKENSVKVPTMSRYAESLNYVKLENAEMAELPYSGGRFSMLVLLPSADYAIEDLEKTLDAGNFAKWTASMKPNRVKLFLPKFKQENDYELSDYLSEMGMPSAFTPGEADFSGITGFNDISISNILHKTFVEVAEEGTEAAAATAVIVMRASMPPDEGGAVVFRADRPFIYVIKDNSTGAILFIGRYSKP